jgi:hypothetical protein
MTPIKILKLLNGEIHYHTEHTTYDKGEIPTYNAEKKLYLKDNGNVMVYYYSFNRNDIEDHYNHNTSESMESNTLKEIYSNGIKEIVYF